MIEIDNVVSLFDGISCLRIALDRENIKFKTYYSSEVDENAIKISKNNYDDIVRCGDVRNIDCNIFKDISLLAGGSPCQSFSFAGKRNGMSTMDTVEILSLDSYLYYKQNNFEFVGRSYLFWEYIRILKETKPKYFLLENVLMDKKWVDVISNALGVRPILINSSLVSAQDRKRLYWTNIPDVLQPSDKHISLESIIDTTVDDKYFVKESSTNYSNYDVYKIDKSIYTITPMQLDNSINFKNAIRNSDKAYTLRALHCNGILDSNYRIRYFTPTECEKLQTLPVGYTDGISNQNRYKCIGNGWTVDVIAHILKNINKVDDNIFF